MFRYVVILVLLREVASFARFFGSISCSSPTGAGADRPTASERQSALRNHVSHAALSSPRRRRRSFASASTALFVSELHVPGYAQTKLPFLLSDEDDGVDANTTPSHFSADNCSYESSIPHEDGFLLHKTIDAVLSAEECQLIIDEAERVASISDWTRSRHGNYPTTDLPIVELPRTLDMFRRALADRIYPLLRSQFSHYLPDPTKLRVADGFVVKYDAEGGQTSLKPHRDGSVLSFNIALNPATEFEGGGTWFDSLDDSVRIDRGQVCSHASALLHGGHPITSGKRYILVAFVILEGFDNWSMRFYNQVRNL